MLEYGNNYYRIGADGKYLPSYSVVNHLFKNEFQKEYRQYSEGEMLQRLKDQIGEYTEKTGGIAEFKYTTDKKHYFVVICAAIMLRAHAKHKLMSLLWLMPLGALIRNDTESTSLLLPVQQEAFL
ncbi:hypothetical protein AVEN_50562-1 [Araneus ventricosus]|uniref:Uncharacterized protein n=1 Tax=Araneus ventricosus TaxID=182803 RepID=A0A4Y2APY0_ARAVE|nr:hypothetical protein AVEN_50562-1 [Araneus ventricosus]